MAESLLMSVSATVALLPAALLPASRSYRRGAVFWLVVAVALAGPLTWAAIRLGGGWRGDLSTTLWVSVAATMAAFALVSVTLREAWRLLPVLLPYLLALAVLATAWQQVPHRPMATDADMAWVTLHIAVSLATYALLTLAAAAAAAAFFQERALKNKRPTGLSRSVPALADCERLTFALLGAAEVVLAFGLLTGMAVAVLAYGQPLPVDHKTILVVTAFVLIGALLIAHRRWGTRGRRMARLVLLAYILVTLGYPGVKFVTDVLMA